MQSVMQPSWTLREAMTKKGRVRFSGNGPLMFPRQLDVVVDAVFVDRTLMRSHHFGSAGKNRKPPNTTRFFATKQQVEALPLSSVVGTSRICRILLV